MAKNISAYVFIADPEYIMHSSIWVTLYEKSRQENNYEERRIICDESTFYWVQYLSLDGQLAECIEEQLT